MKVIIALSLLFAIAVAQQDAPNPYSFNYNSETEDGGSSSHQEEGDGVGNVRGSYTVNNLEGHNRVVEYVADADGFRATVRTNEPGTANLNPADVIMESSADSGAVSYGGGVASPATRPAGRPSAPAAGGAAGARYILVPANDPRARGRY